MPWMNAAAVPVVPVAFSCEGRTAVRRILDIESIAVLACAFWSSR